MPASTALEERASPSEASNAFNDALRRVEDLIKRPFPGLATSIVTNGDAVSHNDVATTDISDHFEGIYEREIAQWQDDQGGYDVIRARFEELCQMPAIAEVIRHQIERDEYRTASPCSVAEDFKKADNANKTNGHRDIPTSNGTDFQASAGAKPADRGPPDIQPDANRTLEESTQAVLAVSAPGPSNPDYQFSDEED
ncbi:MAG: hypothetical protein M4579_003638 [Chaenotheca gracillima]|nr:MAG: hypothetical protein M4579_003638 [Chaenotheca gracillima]